MQMPSYCSDTHSDAQQKNRQKVDSSTSILTPLCVDLDGTLTPSDTLWESLISLIKKKPWSFFSFLPWLRQGRAYFKSRVYDLAPLDPKSIPYNHQLIALLEREKRSGRPLILVTAADDRIAKSVAQHTKLFEKAYGSHSKRNLKSNAKKDFLDQTFSPGQYGYIGNSIDDIPILTSTQDAYLMGKPDSALARRCLKENSNLKIISKNIPKWTYLFKSLRMHQWAKNTLIFVPLILSGHADAYSFVMCSLAFLSFSLSASAVYIVNDLSDLHNDRQDGYKKKRPLASGYMPIPSALFLSLSCLIFSALLALALPPSFFYILFGYLILTTLYTFFLKKQPVADIILLASLYSWRIVAGWSAVAVSLSPWLLAFSGFIFISLAALKRCSELIRLKKKKKSHSVLPGRAYHLEDLDLLENIGVASGYISVLVVALYIYSPAAKNVYELPFYLWISCPILIFWVTKVWFLTHRGRMHVDPVVYALKDFTSLSAGTIMFCASLLANDWQGYGRKLLFILGTH